MSAIGPGTVGSLNLAGSLAGAQQTRAHGDRTKAEGSQRTFQIDQQTLSAHGLDDVAEAELSRDRDADGRLPYERQEPGGSRDQSSRSSAQPQPAPDAFGERGRTLDLEV